MLQVYLDTVCTYQRQFFYIMAGSFHVFDDTTFFYNIYFFMDFGFIMLVKKKLKCKLLITQMTGTLLNL